MTTYEKLWKIAESNKIQRYVGESYTDSLNHTHIGQDYMPFDLTTLDGKRITNKNSIGKITLIIFTLQTCDGWWDFPTLNDLYRANPSFQVVAVMFDKKNIQEFIKKYDILFPIAFVSSLQLHQMNYRNGEPSFILLDKNGKIALLEDRGIDSTHTTISSNAFRKIFYTLL
ncbi:MAG TPA: TlpA disulfide reductase family protein [Flavipsychrobacter sp.]|nr:TlpA disulfide reductase family protein [Flavipsychrobacter sp.]